MAYTGTTLSWQDDCQTNRLYKIAIGTEGTGPDTSEIPLGGNIDWTDNESGGVAEGFEVIDLYLTDDDIDLEPVDGEEVEINPPTAEGIIALIRDKVGLRRVGFTSYEIGAKVLQYTTNAVEVGTDFVTPSPGSGVWVENNEHTRVSVCIEWRGIGCLVLPSCEIAAKPPTGNVKAPATQEAVIDVFCSTLAGTTVKKTHFFLEYNAGA